MIVVNTNVISELWKITPAPSVLAWMDSELVETLYLSSITVAELRFGVAAMPAGKRRAIYQERLERDVLMAFADRVLSFDLDAARAYAELMTRVKAECNAIGKADGYIVATAATRGFTVATRDARRFRAAGLTIINPWES